MRGLRSLNAQEVKRITAVSASDIGRECGSSPSRRNQTYTGLSRRNGKSLRSGFLSWYDGRRNIVGDDERKVVGGIVDKSKEFGEFKRRKTTN